MSEGKAGMAEDVLDLPTLLAPLSTSIDPRTDPSAVSPYRRVKDARSEARDEERARDSEGEEDAPVAEGWRLVRRLGEEILTGSAKDFEVATWLTEALVRQNGLAGLIAGTQLLTGLLETFWDDGFPLPDADGIEDRAIILGGLSGASGDGTIMQPLRRLALFRRTDNTPLPLYRYDQAEEVAGRPDPEYRERRYAAGVPEMAVLEAEASAARPALQALLAQVAVAVETWRRFDAVLTERFSSFGEVPTSRVSRLLERLQEVAQRLAGPAQAGLVAEAPVEGAIPGMAPSSPGPAAGGFQPGDPMAAIATREGALATLERIADFFEKTEPHSPLAYTLRDAARRGRMTLPELLEEVLADETARVGMLSALGIRPVVPE
jgi:type VI secretion system protein ImpA